MKFPYCTENEMQTMENTVNNAFTDIANNSAYKKALDVYKHTHKKVAALIQWFDQVHWAQSQQQNIESNKQRAGDSRDDPQGFGEGQH